MTRLALLLVAASVLLVACSKGAAPPASTGQVSQADRQGRMFREALLAEWKRRPSQPFMDFTQLCHTSFVGKSLRQANAMLRAAGQTFDLFASSQPAGSTPPGTTAFAGGFALHSSFISSAGFNIALYVEPVAPPVSLLVKDVSCGIKETSL